jgi:hypothetical protein
MTPINITVIRVGPSTCLDEDSVGIDAELTVNGELVGVTLVPAHSGYRGIRSWVRFGDLDNWLSQPDVADTLSESDRMVRENILLGIELAVESAALRAGLTPESMA